MKSELKPTNGGEYLIVDLIEVTQKDNSFFIGKVKARDFIKIYTVRPAKYNIEQNTDFAKSFPEEREYYQYLISQDQKFIDNKDFQRDSDDGRVNRIAKFLNEYDYAFFPNTIISNCELINDHSELGLTQESSFDDFINEKDDLNHLSFLYRENGDIKLAIPYIKNSVLVIDGQHRLEGLKKANQSVIDNYELLIAFVIGFNKSVIAKQFYTINYEQKSVNKSLLYHLTGEFSSGLDELTYLHNVVKVFNELETSPLFNRVKMLGKNPPGISQEEKDRLTVSQAFLIDYLLKTISKGAINSVYQPIFLYYFKKEQYQFDIVEFLMKYFEAVKRIVPEWENPNNYMLSKGMGIGALLKSLHFVFPIIFVDKWKLDPKRISSYTIDDLVRDLEGLQNVDFSSTGEFGGVGSAGSMNKLKERIIENLVITGHQDFNAFLQEYKSEKGIYSQFNKWLIKNL